MIVMANSVAIRLLGLAISAGLTGCADFFEQHRVFQDGWRTGEIVELGRANEIQRGGRTIAGRRPAPTNLQYSASPSWSIVPRGSATRTS